jgi:hypothetical protein
VVVDELHVPAEGLVGVPEPIATLRVTIANLADCVIGFKTGQEGIETWPNEDSLPPGWKNDTTRHEAQRGELLVPGSYGEWIMTYRKAEYEPGEGNGELSLRAEGTLASGENWSAPIAVGVTEAARKRLSPSPYERFHSRYPSSDCMSTRLSNSTDELGLLKFDIGSPCVVSCLHERPEVQAYGGDYGRPRCPHQLAV